MRRLLTAPLCAAAMLTPCARQAARARAAAPAPSVLLLRERPMRDRARVEVLPQYPAAALKEGARGVVVAQTELGAEGTEGEKED